MTGYAAMCPLLVFGRRLYSVGSQCSTGLTPAQVAFAKRLGIEDLAADRLLLALRHPRLPEYLKYYCVEETDRPVTPLEVHESLCQKGLSLLRDSAARYFQTKFPRYAAWSCEKNLAVDSFTSDRVVVQTARHLGIEAAVGSDVRRFDLSKSLPKRAGRARAAQQTPEAVRADGELALRLQVEAFLAVVAVMAEDLGPGRTGGFLQARHFGNGLFDKNLLLREAYPVVKLTEVHECFKYGRKLDLEFRLHQESGRLSNDSMFVVGVYGGSLERVSEPEPVLLGEGYGASIALAQQRAALDALRRYFLVEEAVSVVE